MAGGLFFCPNQHDHRPTKQASCSFGLWRREAAIVMRAWALYMGPYRERGSASSSACAKFK
jgi:hypothetical protein